MTVKTLLKRTWQYLGLALLVLTFVWSMLWVNLVGGEDGVPLAGDRKVIRLVHSQSEEGVNAALRQLAAEYEQLHPDVRVVVQSIPQRAYLQWVNVQLLGEMAPDIIETLNRADQMWEMLATRYFLPLTAHVNQPNPYNADNDLAEVIWRNTYVDGMTGGYWFHLMEYYSVPLTIDLSRMFYNRDLLREITGSDQSPRDFSEWMAMCRAIRAYSERTGQTIAPIATANYGGNQLYGFYGRYFPTMTAGMLDAYDPGYTGIPDATFILLQLVGDGPFSLVNDRFAAAFGLLRELSTQFQGGFQSALPAQARFLFIQRKAAMIKGSVRDVRVFRESCDFDLGVFDFPLPRPEHPRYGRYVAGPVAEAPTGRFHFGVAKQSPHKQEAIDFLRFITARRQNAQFNRALMWYPVIRDAEPHPFLAAFEPHPEGVYRYPLLWQGGGVKLWWDQHYPLFLAGELDFETFMRQYEKIWKTIGVRDFLRRDALYAKMTFQGEYSLAAARSTKLFEQAGDLQAGRVVGFCDEYQLAAEVMHLFYHGISHRKYQWEQLQPDQPVPPADPEAAP